MSATTSAGVNFQERIQALPTMSEEEMSQLTLWLDEQRKFVQSKVDAEEVATDGGCKKTDWWRRARAFTRKAAHLMLAIQEERGKRRRARQVACEDDPDRKWSGFIKRAMKALLTAEQYDKVIATAIELKQSEASQ